MNSILCACGHEPRQWLVFRQPENAIIPMYQMVYSPAHTRNCETQAFSHQNGLQDYHIPRKCANDGKSQRVNPRIVTIALVLYMLEHAAQAYRAIHQVNN